MFAVLITALVCALVLYTYLLNNKQKNFPAGPLSLPIIGTLYMLGTEPHKTLAKMKKKYGSVVRIDFGSYLGIVLNDHKAIKEMLNLPALNYRPEYGIFNHIRKGANEGTIFVNGKTWEEQRKFLFDYLRIMRKDKNAFEVVILEQLEYIKKKLDTQLGEPFQTSNFFNTSAVAPMYTVLTGKSADPESAHFQHCVNLMIRVAEKFSSAGAVYFMPTVCKLFPNVTGWNDVVESATQNIDFVKSLLQPYIASYKVEDFPNNLIEEYLYKVKTTEDKESSFFGQTGENNLITSVWDVLLAGTETVSTALTWYINLIAHFPDVQKKVQKEIDTLIGDGPPCLEDRSNLHYTEASVFEAIRYASISPLSSPRATGEDVYFRGYFIPKGTIVVPNLYEALHDPYLWEDPDSFMPERFLSKDGTTVLRDKTLLTNFVFGSGKRGCPGASLAKDQVFLMATGLLQKYNFDVDASVQKGNIETHLGGTLSPIYKPIIVTKR